MSSFRAAAIAFLVLASPCLAQPVAGRVQPDHIDFGTVYTGAVVQGSFLVMEAGVDANIEFTVAAPKFVKILNKSTEAREFGPNNKFVCGSVEFAIDTSGVGQVEGQVSMTLGRTKATIPIRAVVEKRLPGSPRVLIVSSPFNRYSTGDGRMFQTWTDLVKKAKADVSYLLVHNEKEVFRDLDLTPFTCILLADEGLVRLTPVDVNKARQFAFGGGRVVVTANYFMRGTVEKANAVLDGYGLEIQDKEEGGGDATVTKDGLSELAIEAEINSVHFFRASPIVVNDLMGGQVLVKAKGVGEPADGFVARTRVRGRGEMIAIGQSLWWHWITPQQAGQADNGKLLIWLLMLPKAK